MKERILEYKGKSKDLYALPNGNILMVFGDAFTGADGVEDPGANQNMGVKEGLGKRNLAISSKIFSEISKELNVPTHHVKVDLDKGELEAVRAETLGKGYEFEVDGKKFQAAGLEFIARNLAWGSFIKRFPSANEGMLLADAPLIEVSVKNDDANDPFFTKEEYVKGGIKAEHYDKGVEHTKKVAIHLSQHFTKVNLELIDIKMEFGVTKGGELILIDEISPGSLRALKDGKLATKEEIYEALMS